MEIKNAKQNFFMEIEYPSKISAMLKRRRQRHKIHLDTMKKSLSNVNEEFDLQIRLQSEETKMKLSVLQNAMELQLKNIIQKLQTAPNDEIQIEEIENKLHEIYCSRNEVIDDFQKLLYLIEKERSTSLKSSLKTYYQEEYELLHQSPWEIDYDIEHKILNINTIILNNFRCYTDLCYNLKLQTAYEIYKMDLKIKGLLLEHNLLDTKRSKIKNESVGSNVDQENKKSKIYFATPLTTSDEIEAWCREIQYNLNVLDHKSRKLVNLYKTAVINVFNRLFDQLKNIVGSNLEEEYSADEVNNEVFKSIIDDIMQQYSFEITDIQSAWNKVVEYMQNSIKTNQNFLCGTIKLWDPHYKRTQGIQRLILCDLDKTIEKNDATAQNFEKKISIAVDKLRQESNAEKIDVAFNATKKLFDSIEKMYTAQHEAEIKVVEKYRTFVDKEIDYLLSEIQLFLEESTIENMPNLKTGDGRESQEPQLDESTKQLIPYQINVCKCQVEAVNNWRFGLWEAIKMYLTSSKKELSDEANIWIEKIINKLQKRLDIRQTMLKLRYGRLEKIIKEIRLKEIENHLEALEKIEKKTLEEISKSKKGIHDCSAQYVEIKNEHEKFVDETDIKLLSLKKVLEVLSLEKQFCKYTTDAKNNMEMVSNENVAFCNESQSKTKIFISNVARHIRLFSNTGDYSHEEVKPMFKKLIKMSNTLAKHYMPLRKEIDHTYTQTLSAISQKEADMNSRILKVKSEIEFKENTVSMICRLQKNIREKVYQLKYKVKLIQKYIEDLKDTCRLNLVQQESINVVKVKLDKYLKQILGFLEYMLLRDESNSEDNVIIEEEHRQAEKFWPKTIELIEETRREITSLAKNFYEKNNTIVTQQKLQPNYSDFIDETGHILNDYEKQSRIVWLKSIEETLENLSSLLPFLDEFHVTTIVKCINDTSSTVKSRINKKFENLQDKLNEIEKKCINDYCISEGYENETNVQEIVLQNIDNEYNSIKNQIIEAAQKQLLVEYEQIETNTKTLHDILRHISRNAALHDLINRLLNLLKQNLADEHLHSSQELKCVDQELNVQTLYETSKNQNLKSLSELLFIADPSPSKMSMFKNFFAMLEDEEKKQSGAFLSTYIASGLQNINNQFKSAHSIMDEMKSSSRCLYNNKEIEANLNEG